MSSVFRSVACISAMFAGGEVSANAQIGARDSAWRSYIVKQDSVWVWYHSRSVESTVRDTVILLTNTPTADSVAHSFVVYSSGRGAVLVQAEAWQSSLPSTVVRVASIEPPVILDAISGEFALATSARHSRGSVIYLDAYAIG